MLGVVNLSIGDVGIAGSIEGNTAQGNGVLVTAHGELELLHDIILRVAHHVIGSICDINSLDDKWSLLVQTHFHLPSIESRSRGVSLKDYSHRAIFGLAHEVGRASDGAVACDIAQDILFVGLTAAVNHHLARANRECVQGVDLHGTVVTAGNKCHSSLESLSELAIGTTVVVEEQRLSDGNDVVALLHEVDVLNHAVALGVAILDGGGSASGVYYRHQFGIHYALGSSVGLNVDVHPPVVVALSKLALTAHGDGAGLGVLNSTKLNGAGAVVSVVVEYTHLADSCLRVLEIKVDVLNGHEREGALGFKVEVDELGTSSAHSKHVAAGLVNGDVLHTHVVVLERLNDSSPSSSSIVAAGGLGVETDGQRAVGAL